MTGNPVRADILDLSGKKAEAVSFFGMAPDKKTVLVVGGSQGSRTINRSILAGIKKFSDENVQLIWQTGVPFLPEAKEAVSKTGAGTLKAFDFITRMDLAYALADLVISRAGSSTVSELCIARKASIMVPLPTAAEDHQTKNIQSLVNRSAAVMVKDAEAGEKLVEVALELLLNENKLEELRSNISKLALPHSAVEIAKQVRALAVKK